MYRFLLFLLSFLTSSFHLELCAQLTQFNGSGGSTTLTYVSLLGSGATVSSATGDDGQDTSISIGFDFIFDGVQHTIFTISTNGLIQLGGGVISNSKNNLTQTGIDKAIIAPLWDDHHLHHGTIRYLSTGGVGSRILTVEWDSISISNQGDTSSTRVSSFQLKLFENSSKIEFLYGSIDTASAIHATIGLMGYDSYYTLNSTNSYSYNLIYDSISSNHAMTNLANTRFILQPNTRAISSYPFYEDFENGLYDTLNFDYGWVQHSSSGNQRWVANTSKNSFQRGPYSGAWSSYLKKNNEDWLFFPIGLIHTYNFTLSVYARQNTMDTNAAKISLYYGSYPHPDSMNQVLAPCGLDTNYKKFANSFLAIYHPNYYIGLKGWINSVPEYMTIDSLSIILTPAIPLPVKWKSFDLTKNSDFIELNWITVSEKNSDKFEIERSSDAVSFYKIGEVKSAGNSQSENNYNWIDINPIYSKSNNIYYRLKQCDNDGNYEFSQIKTVRQNTNTIEIETYPNPSNKYITIKSNLLKTKFNIDIFNTEGKKVKTIPSNESTNKLIIDVSDLSKGNYSLRLNHQYIGFQIQ